MQTTAGLPWALKVTAAYRFDGSSVLSVPSVPRHRVHGYPTSRNLSIQATQGRLTEGSSDGKVDGFVVWASPVSVRMMEMQDRW
jgi:hypothetical protein